MYKLGTLKVAWIENNPEYMSSVMFNEDELEKAVKFGKTKDNFIIMKLCNESNHFYQWRLLKYGDYNKYILSMKLRRNSIIIALVLVLLAILLVSILV